MDQGNGMRGEIAVGVCLTGCLAMLWQHDGGKVRTGRGTQGRVWGCSVCSPEAKRSGLKAARRGSKVMTALRRMSRWVAGGASPLSVSQLVHA